MRQSVVQPVLRRPASVLAELWAGPAPRWAAWVLVGCALIVVCGLYVDHPVARYVHTQIVFSRDGRRFVHIPELVIALSVAAVSVLGFWRATLGRLGGWWQTLLLAGLSVCVALTFTEVLKLWFGRIPPGIWYYQQWRNTYAWMSGSFPSGHMTAMGAVAPFLWARRRVLLLPWVAVALAACFGLVTQQAHFISDLIGGAVVGGSVGYGMLCAERRAAR